MNEFVFRAPKRCSCGRMHFTLPDSYRMQAANDPFDGIYFECVECQSTLFVRVDDVVEIDALEAEAA